MEYYYDSTTFSPSLKIKKLKKKVEIKAVELASEISKALFKDINYGWTRRNTLGFVFIDFEFETTSVFGATRERLIGKGEKDLAESIKDAYKCLVLSKSLGKNFREFKLDGALGIEININYFKEFLSIIRERKNTVKLFLYRFANKKQEELIRNWLRSYGKFEEIQKEPLIDIDAMVDVINKHRIERPEDLNKLITIAKASGGSIASSYEFFESKLKEFKELIDSNENEIKIRNFLFDYIWILDFQYMSYSKKKEEETPVGDIDISLLKDSMKINRAVVAELKASSKKVITDNYRGEDKPVILAEVGKAISQTIHYMEQNKTPYRVLKGIVLIGRRKGLQEDFLKVFSSYLHGIEVLTYDDIYDRANDVIKTFKTAQEPTVTKT